METQEPAHLNGISSDYSYLLGHFTITSLCLGLWILVKIGKGPKFYWRIFECIPRDLKALSKLLRVMRDLMLFRIRDWTIFKAFDNTVKNNPNKVLFYFEEEKWTAQQVQEMSFRVANCFQCMGYGKGDTVGIFMPNCVEYIPLWLGLTRIGCNAALINYNLRKQQLEHCIKAVGCKGVIFSSSLNEAVRDLITDEDMENVQFFSFQRNEGISDKKPLASYLLPNMKDLNNMLEKSDAWPPVVNELIGFNDQTLYIFTSGTTGFPKAARIKHSRLLVTVLSKYFFELSKDDILYTTLPLYHTAATVAGTCGTLVYGHSQVIKAKFSASSFWKDCVQYNAFQYIGELCRYLLVQPRSEWERKHKVRVMFGNGLRQEIWEEFVNRFNIPKVAEVYGATEGASGLFNTDSTPGAVGFQPVYIPPLLLSCLIKVNMESGEPIRNNKGFIQRCGFNEPGEYIARIFNSPVAHFEGYNDKAATEGKILRNVFWKGDKWYRSGDILERDDRGYFYFKDRRGDTFRWKGENCSTTEIESVLSKAVGMDYEVIVFGVFIPGKEGKAGMAVISDPQGTLDLNQLAERVKSDLPSYARPVFLRVSDKGVASTGTFKHRKVEYTDIGFNIHLTKDKICFWKDDKYIPLCSDLYSMIVNGNIKL